MKFLLPAVAFTLLAGGIHAQTPEQPNRADKDFPTTLQNVNPVKYYGPKKQKKKKTKKTTTYNAKNEYYDRVEKVWREQEKREKIYERGEGPDMMKPPYFGHKKPPKIRPLEKRKYCKICGIRH
jgi:hypothetical protein